MKILVRKAASWRYLLGVVACTGLASLSPVTPLMAADAVQSSDTGMLEEITVTAQRREENLQTVPIVVDTISAAVAEERGATNIGSLIAETPNISFTMASGNTNTYIRGVGDNSASFNNEPSAAIYIDGVYYAQAQAITSFNFNNIERIEVLKGPQGTLFGRNATAGVIQILTPDPKQELSGKVDVGYGNYDTINAVGYVTGGISDKLAADVAVLELDQIDGFGRDFTTDTPTFRQRDTAVRSKWLYELSAATKIRFTVDYANYASDGDADQYVPVSAGLKPPVTAYNHYPYAGKYNTWGNYNTVLDNMQYGAALTVDHDFGSLVHGQSITSYRWVDGLGTIDSDFTPATINSIFSHFDSHYVTQEFHLSNQNPGRITWLAGVFYYGNEVYGSDPRIQFGTSLPGGYREYIGDQNVASGSVFGQATADIIDNTKLTLGARYTDETIKAFSNTRNQAGTIVGGPYDQGIRADPLTWRVAIDHQFTSDLMGYVSYDRGYKSGGFNLASPGSAPFFPEHVDAYEAGIKSEFLDHRVRLNLAGFYYHYQDIQVAVVLGGSQLFQNAASARNAGLDESLDFVATEHLTFSSGIGLLSAKYLDYPNARGYTPAGVAFPIANAKGADLPFAPPYSGFISANYHDLVTPIGKFGATVDVSYNDRSFATPDMGIERPTYYMLNATTQWRAPFDDSFSVRVWGKNLTNATTYNFTSESASGWYVAYGPPRTYGVTVEKAF